MKICHIHDAVYNEQTGGCPVCELRVSDPLCIVREDIVRVETDLLAIVERGRVLKVGCPKTNWMIYDLEEEVLRCISLGCIVTKLEETYDNARKR